MSVAIYQVAIIFIAISAGFICRKTNVMTEESTAGLSSIVVKLILPFYLFNAIVSSTSGVDTKGVLSTLALSAAMFLISGLIAVLVVPLLHTPKEDCGVYMFEIMCGNVTYIGIPVCASVIGGNAAFYASLVNIPYNLLCFSLGIFLLSGKMSWKRILNPSFICGTAATILYILKVPIPSVITDACALIGQATSPCAMLIIGSTLASVPLRDIFTEWRAVPYVVLRLFGVAAIIAFCVRFLPIDPALKNVLILMAAMPAATNSTMLCTIYGGNRALSAKLIFLSTALSIITIPLWAQYLIG